MISHLRRVISSCFTAWFVLIGVPAALALRPAGVEEAGPLVVEPQRRIVQVPWPILLPGSIPALPPAGEVSSGLEEKRLLHSEIGSSV